MASARAIGRPWRWITGSLVFVWSVWLVLSFYLLDFVRSYCVDVPFYDEWEVLPVMLREQPITLEWLWSQHNEHRMFLGRLIYLGVERAAHYDFRAGAWLDACLLCAAAAALIAFAHRLRGWSTYSDAFFPLVLLNWGQAENLIWSFQVQFVSASVLAIAVLMLVASPGRMTFGAAMALAASTLLLPLFGGNGLALVPALAICVGLAGWDLRSGDGGRMGRALSVWALGLVAVALAAFYFVGYQQPPGLPGSRSVVATLTGAMRFLTVGVGSGAKTSWLQYVLLVSFGAAVVALVATVTRTRGAGSAPRVLLFLASLGTLALGIGWARTPLSPGAVYASRYATLAAPFSCAVYLAWESVDCSTLRRFAQAVLFLSAAALVLANRSEGVREASWHQFLRASIVADVRGGTPLAEIVKRYDGKIYYGGPDALAAGMRLLHAHGIGAFRDLKE